MNLFAMYDKKAGHYLQVFPDSSTISALRGFEVAVNDAKSIFSRFPDDFHLHLLAHFDQQTGIVLPIEPPQDLGSARTVLKAPSHQQTLAFPENAVKN